MSLGEILFKIGNEYLQAKSQPLAKHPLAQYVGKTALEELRKVPCITSWDVNGSTGNGEWADVPWLAFFDTTVTDTVQEGQYVVYLFAPTRREIYLSLNQGTKNIIDLFGEREGRKILIQRAALMRTIASEMGEVLPEFEMDLGSKNARPLRYQHGHAVGFRYSVDSLPSEASLQTDLSKILRIYKHIVETLEFKDDQDFFDDVDESATSDGNKNESKTSRVKRLLLESKQYKAHRRIERRPGLSNEVKKLQGLTCQGCEVDFGKKFGEHAKSCVDAHHLTPLSSLLLNSQVLSDPETDFAVLCATCHRLIHRLPNPSDVKALRIYLSATE